MHAHLVLLPGDGIGPEVTRAAVEVIKTAGSGFGLTFSFEEHKMGGCSYDAFGTPVTDETITACKNAHAVFLGAVGGYQWDSLPHHLKPEAALLRLRSELGLYTNIRPAKIYPALISSSSLKEEVLQGVDFVVLRELTGGIYFGKPREYSTDYGLNTMVYTRPEVERIARMAFTIARQRNLKVTSVDKANVLEVSQFWRNVVHEVHTEYSDVELHDMYVDNAAMQIVRNPRQFDVILTSNLFGDILSDIAGMITGSLGMLPSASLGSEHALYEPVHGSAPDIAGKNMANPLAAISSAAMLFTHTLKMQEAGYLIEEAVASVLAEGYRTADIHCEGCKLVTTTEMTGQVIRILNSLLVQKHVANVV
ncbi:MAG: 3-isopropylmalate dehydrogenase [Ignavibacteria bacterium]|nr:3-isopropylmalate dehydrogenase [Ignavibacteria bacterium]